MGFRLAEQHPHSVQPRLGRPRRAALVGTQKIGLVGLREAALGRTRHTGLRSGEAARLQTPSGRDGHGGHRRHASLHHEVRRAGLAVLPRHQGWASADHYEPVESPFGNLLYPKHDSNPTVRFFEGPLNHIAHTPTADYPVVATTFRLTEHYLSGPMSRFNSWLNELQPEMFAELSPELAAERGIVHGGWMTIQNGARSKSRPVRW